MLHKPRPPAFILFRNVFIDRYAALGAAAFFSNSFWQAR